MKHIKLTPLLPAAVIQPAPRQHRADRRARHADGDLHFELTGPEAPAAYRQQEQQKQAKRDLAEAKRQERLRRKNMTPEEKKAERTKKAAAPSRRQAKRAAEAIATVAGGQLALSLALSLSLIMMASRRIPDRSLTHPQQQQSDAPALPSESGER